MDKPAPSTHLNPSELQTLELVCDTLLPPEESAWRASVVERVRATLNRHVNQDQLDQFRLFLKLVELPPANLLIGHRWKRFSVMSRPEREAYLRALAQHRLTLVRAAFQALKNLAAYAYYVDTDLSGMNPTWRALGYPGPVAPISAVRKTIQPLCVDRDLQLDCDAVIVGSGAGGGVVAGELTAAGYNVIVLEKGVYANEGDFTHRESEAFRTLYLGSGMTTSDDLGIVVLAGSCLGGGTVVNYTTSFRTPDSVRAEWARLSGLDFFVQDAFTRALDAVWERLKVNLNHNLPSKRDEIMAAGLAACGWHADRMPRNVNGCTEDDVCGYCGLGCIRGAKQSMTETYLQDAFARGARILVNCEGERVLIERGRAHGIKARTREGHEVTIRARVVVAAAGAIHSPALLLRSGLRANVGQNLRLHPSTPVWGCFPREIRPWTGTLQAVYSDQFADLDEGYGLKLETAPSHPLLLMGLGAAWESAAQFDARMQTLAHLSLVSIVLRDRYGGCVTLNRSGVPVIHYRLSRYDQRHVRRGVESAARVLLAAGAHQVFTSQTRSVNFDRDGSETLDQWLTRVDRVGYGANQMLYGSGHQMGTCRMGKLPATSVVNGEGETHAVRRLYVADGSLFPSSSGVNPMITIAALGYHVAQQIRNQL